MKVIIGNDHRGYFMKQRLMTYLKNKGYEVIDCGTDTEDAVDYPLYAKKVAKKVLEEKALGILICGTGIGMSIAANKIKGIRCAKVSNEEEARLTRLDNDANIIALSYKLEGEDAEKIVEMFITTESSLEARHIYRRDLIKELENDN